MWPSQNIWTLNLYKNHEWVIECIWVICFKFTYKKCHIFYIIVKPKLNTNQFRMFSEIKKRNLCRVFEYWAEKFTSAFTLEVLKAQKLFFSHAKAKNFFFIGTTVLQSVFFNESKVCFALQNKVLGWSLLSKFNFRISGKTLDVFAFTFWLTKALLY